MYKYKLNNSLQKQLVNVRRNITVSLVGTTNNSIFSNTSLRFENPSQFVKHVSGYFRAFTYFKVLTNRSKMVAVIVNLMLVSLLISVLITSKFYTFLQSTNRSICIPAGLVKLLDYICVPSECNDPTGGYHSGRVVAHTDFVELSTFIRRNYLDIVNTGKALGNDLIVIENKNQVIKNNVQTLLDTISLIGYSCSTRDLTDALTHISTKFESLTSENEIFELVITVFESLRSILIDVSFIDFMPKRSNTSKVGVYKIRSYSDRTGYLVNRKAFESLEVVSQQITYYYLFLMRPVILVNDVNSVSHQFDEALLEFGPYQTHAVLRALFSIDTVNIGTGATSSNDIDGGSPNTQTVRHFSTHAHSSASMHSALFMTKKYARATYYNCRTTVFFVQNALPITWKDYH